ncbi:hypothetical protein GT354_35720 [Streptomyces sp. SID3343]|nr:hypothetical protein [Streptomyces sp. SID3343]
MRFGPVGLVGCVGCVGCVVGPVGPVGPVGLVGLVGCVGYFGRLVHVTPGGFEEAAPSRSRIFAPSRPIVPTSPSSAVVRRWFVGWTAARARSQPVRPTSRSPALPVRSSAPVFPAPPRELREPVLFRRSVGR